MPINQVKKFRLGDLLLQHQLIDEAQLTMALKDQQTHGGKLGNILIKLGYIEQDILYSFLSTHLNIPFIDLKHYAIKPELIRQLPETYARHFHAILLDDSSQGFLVGMSDPQDIFALDELKTILKRPILSAIVREVDLLYTIDAVYRNTEEISSFAQELSVEMNVDSFDIAQLEKQVGVPDAPVVRLLQSLFEESVQMGASDIHIEPDETVLRIRQRIDGVLSEQIVKEFRIASALTQRLKLMAKLNIAERRMPQDGRFSIKVKNRTIDIRLSTMPVQFGESVVMRLLDRNISTLQLDQLGMSEALQKKMRRLRSMPNGMILVTGVTGSGKTTTLYSLLGELNCVENKIITVEDPIEYHLPRINQVQVNAQIDLDFARILRSALRQDPDIIMVGEIRDEETANIAMRAAMTGHLVLATMHTNDAISSATRLLDMQTQSYVVASALRAILSQSLLRKNCENCTQPYQPTPQEHIWINASLGSKKITAQFKKGKGCSHCNNTGYKGRIGIFELLELNESMAEALQRNSSADFTKSAREQLGDNTLLLSALEIAAQGITSIQEVKRITAQIAEIAE